MLRTAYATFGLCVEQTQNSPRLSVQAFARFSQLSVLALQTTLVGFSILNVPTGRIFYFLT